MNCPAELADLHAVDNPMIEGARERKDGPNDNFTVSHDRFLFHFAHDDDGRNLGSGEERRHTGRETETADVGDNE